MQFALIDDHKMVREGFKRLIELTQDHHVVFESDCYKHAVNAFKQHSDSDIDIDIAIVDISLSDKNGIELLKYCSLNFSKTKCIVVSMYDHNPYVSNAMDAGAWGYVSKRAAADELLEAIQTVSKGDNYLSHDVRQYLHISNDGKSNSNLKLLTQRELDVFPLLAKGLNAKQIAQQLDIMPKTAHVHRASVLKKLNVENQFDLLKIAISSGVITYGELAE